MIWATSGVAFAAVVLIVLAVAYGFSGANLPAAERLTRLWQPPSADKRLGFRDKQKQKVQQVLGDVGRLVPTSTQALATHPTHDGAGGLSPSGIGAWPCRA